MQIGVFAKTFPGDHPDQILNACKTAGFDAVQYNMSCSGLKSLPSSISDQTAEAVRNAAANADIQISAISATYNMTDPDPQRRKAGRTGFKTIADSAAQIGSNLLTLCSGSLDPQDQWRYHPANKDPESWLDMCREFEIVLDCADQHDLYVGVEPEHANVVSSSQKARQLLDEFPGSRIVIVLDPANLLENKSPDDQNNILSEAFDLLGPNIALAHAKDRDINGAVVPAGSGIVDWALFIRGLERIGFNGPLIAHGITEDDAPSVAKFLSQQLEQL